MSESNNTDLEKVLSYPLSSVSWSLVTANGAPAKADKVQLLHYLENDMELKRSQAVKILLIFWMGMLFDIHSLSFQFHLNKLQKRCLMYFQKLSKWVLQLTATALTP